MLNRVPVCCHSVYFSFCLLSAAVVVVVLQSSSFSSFAEDGKRVSGVGVGSGQRRRVTLMLMLVAERH
jgi:hypothetical protein